MQVIADRYHLDAELGTGGTATVWLARDLVLDRPCAVKLLLPTTGRDTDARAVVREYEAGVSLAAVLPRAGPLAPTRAVRLVLQVLDALSAAHGEGIVHRDVKPGNILLRSESEVALCDFGIARFERVDGGTRTGVALGSVGFMAPEQRIDARRVGPAADVYSCACTMFNLLSDDTPVDLYLAPDHSPRWEAVPAPLRPILRRATRTDPTDRYVSAEEMAEALRSVLPALESFTAARRRATETPVGAYPATQVPGSAGAVLSLDAQSRERKLDPEDWAWASQSSRPAGRTALWVGVALVFAITLAGLATGPALDDLQSRVAPAPVPAVPLAIEPQDAAPLYGEWRGNLAGDRPLRVVLRERGDGVAGEIAVTLGKNVMHASVSGTWDAASGELVLREPGTSTWRARRGEAPGLLVGSMQRTVESPPLTFALVWVGEAQ